MDGGNVQNRTLMENEAVRQFLKNLMRERPDAGQAYFAMLRQMDGMAKQLDAALKELAEARVQLAGIRENPGKASLSQDIWIVGERLHIVRDSMAGMKAQIIEGAKEAVAGMKRFGIKALDKAVSAVGIRKGLEAVQAGLSCSISDVEKSIGKVEAMGRELRSVGGHLKNAGRAVAGKELEAVDGGTEGRFQAAVLAPLRREKGILDKMNNLALAAIGNVERLEAAGERARDNAARAGSLKGPDKAETGKEAQPPGVAPFLKEAAMPKEGMPSRGTAPPRRTVPADRTAPPGEMPSQKAAFPPRGAEQQKGAAHQGWERSAVEKPSVMKSLQENRKQAAAYAAHAAPGTERRNVQQAVL